MSTQDEQIQRLNYFDNQFLKAEDFTTEQEYHLEMRRRHNRVLHTKGVAEGLQIKKKDNKTITVKAGTAIDSYGNEIVLLKDLSISLADTTKYPKDATVYIFASYKEESGKQQPETSNDPNLSTRFFENAVIKDENEEPTKDPEIVRLGRLKFDRDGNVPDQAVNVPDNAQFLNKDFREEAAAKLPTFSISIQQLKTKIVAQSSGSNAKPIKNLGSDPVQIIAYDSSDPSENERIGAFLLVYAYSDTPDTQFTWRQTYSTEKQDKKLIYKQFVEFTNTTPLATKINELHYTIYAVSEEN